MNFVYVLHFDTKLSHAEHYTGCTQRLIQRLMSHATGQGSRLTRELHRQGIEWQLAGLYEATRKKMRAAERHLKDQKNAGRYCRVCSQPPAILPGCTPWEPEATGFTTTSKELRKLAREIGKGSGSLTMEVAEDGPERKWVISQQHTESEALGFIPLTAGRQDGTIYKGGTVRIVRRGAEKIGFVAFTTNQTLKILTVQQLYIADEFRLRGEGRRVLEALRKEYHDMMFQARVRNDLSACEFWLRSGFQWFDQVEHDTSSQKLNVFIASPKGGK